VSLNEGKIDEKEDDMQTKLHRAMTVVILIAFCFTVLPAPALYAKMLGTETVLANDLKEVRTKLMSFLDNQAVVEALESRGITREEAEARVSALSEEQLRFAARHLDSLPSGGDLSGIVTVMAIIFLVLLITDILGWTNIFTFVIPRR
jgi:hypothetical protein